MICDLQGRLKPGRMLLVDTKEKVFMKDEAIKAHLAHLRPYGKWLAEQVNLVKKLQLSGLILTRHLKELLACSYTGCPLM